MELTSAPERASPRTPRHGSARAGIERTRHVGIALDELHEPLVPCFRVGRRRRVLDEHVGDERPGERRPEHRSPAQERAVGRRQPVDARRDQGADGLRQFLRLVGRPVDSRKLLEEERVPGTALGDRLQLLSGERPPCSGLDQGPGVVGGERLEPGVSSREGAVCPRRRGTRRRSAFASCTQPRSRRQLCREVAEQVRRGLVHPLDVLEDHERRRTQRTAEASRRRRAVARA